MNLSGKTLKSGDLVRHSRLGVGKVRFDEGDTALVRFEDAIHPGVKPRWPRRHTRVHLVHYSGGDGHGNS